MSKTVSSGVVHEIPTDLRKALTADRAARAIWEDLTPLARNEWICWVTFVKKDETRKEHVKRAITELKEGIRRPCCWLGCIHRKDKQLSPSVRAILDKRSRKSIWGILLVYLFPKGDAYLSSGISFFDDDRTALLVSTCFRCLHLDQGQCKNRFGYPIFF